MYPNQSKVIWLVFTPSSISAVCDKLAPKKKKKFQKKKKKKISL